MSVYKKLIDLDTRLTTAENSIYGGVTSTLTASNVLVTNLTAINLQATDSVANNSQTGIFRVDDDLITANLSGSRRVGINTDAPTETFTVNGTSHFSGSMTVTQTVSGTTSQFNVARIVPRESAPSNVTGSLYVRDDGTLWFYGSGGWQQIALI
jgi:hypothetical protein